MSWMARLSSVTGGMFHRTRMEQDMDAELRFHVAAYAEDLVRSGVQRDEAERRARIEFGHLVPIKEDCRQARGLRLLDETSQDLRYAVRMLRKSPAFAAIAVLTLALGIGSNTSIFSVVNAWVLKPLPYPNPDQLVAIWTTDKKQNWASATSPADLYDWRRENRAFDAICGWTNPFFTLQQGDQPEQILGGRVNAEFFRTLGVVPQMGRYFLPQEDRPNAPPVAVLSHGLWQSHFGGDAALIGRTIRVDGENVTVVGILPAGFHLPLAGDAELWMPLALSDEDVKNRRIRFLQVIARTKPGVSLAGAASQMKTVAGRLEQSYPATNTGRAVRIETLSDAIGRQGGNDRALVLFALVGCVLMLACGNVANLIVGRAVGRRKEMAVRLAMGAGRARVLRQVLIENLVLFAIAAALSILFALWGVRWIADSIPYNFRAFLPNRGTLRVDMPTLLYTLCIGMTTGLVFGFAPAFRCWRIDVNHALKESTSRASGTEGSSRLKNLLIVFEISLAMVILAASGLLIKGLVRMYASDPGFNRKGLVTARMILPASKYGDLKRAEIFYDSVLAEIRKAPGVKAAGAASFLPYSGDDSTTYYAIEGQPAPPPGELPYMSFDVVTPDYFSAMGIRLLRGRTFSEQDRADSAPVIIVNQTLARRDFPGEDPVGRRIRYGASLARSATIAGVVEDIQGLNDTDTPMPEGYVPYRQVPARSMMLAIRTDSSVVALPAEIRRAVSVVDKGQAVFGIATMDELMTERQAPFRIVGEVTMFFSGLALFLAALGIYGVVAYSVAARRQEFGIRMALGAARRDLLSLVVGQGLKLAFIGLAIGLGASLAVTRFMTSILYHVSPTDAPTFTFISALLLLVAALACYLPARRVSTVDPTRALRYE